LSSGRRFLRTRPQGSARRPQGAGLEEGKHFVLHVRDARGDLKAAEEAARNLEAEKVKEIVTFATSVSLAAKQATKSVPIVSYAGADPVCPSDLIERSVP
jgi:ABC-type uncharacterized transport system substrate-binding protein